MGQKRIKSLSLDKVQAIEAVVSSLREDMDEYLLHRV